MVAKVSSAQNSTGSPAIESQFPAQPPGLGVHVRLSEGRLNPCPSLEGTPLEPVFAAHLEINPVAIGAVAAQIRRSEAVPVRVFIELENPESTALLAMGITSIELAWDQASTLSALPDRSNSACGSRSNANLLLTSEKNSSFQTCEQLLNKTSQTPQ